MPVPTQVLLGQSQKDCGQRLDVGKAKERQKKERDQRGRDRVVGGLILNTPHLSNPLSPPSQGGYSVLCSTFSGFLCSLAISWKESLSLWYWIMSVALPDSKAELKAYSYKKH